MFRLNEMKENVIKYFSYYKLTKNLTFPVKTHTQIIIFLMAVLVPQVMPIHFARALPGRALDA